MHPAPPFDKATIPFVGSMHRALVYFGHDGDTVFPVVDLAFGATWSKPEKGLRLVGGGGRPFNAPELNATNPSERLAAIQSRDRVKALTLDRFVYVQSFKPANDDKYGRWLMCVWVPITDDMRAVPHMAFASTYGIPSADVFEDTQCFDLAAQLVYENLGVWGMG